MATAFQYKVNWETERYTLLNTPICELQFNLKETLLFRCIQKLYLELNRKGLSFKPPYYFTCENDEWGCPDRVPIIGIPFHLADNRLVRIEKEMGYPAYTQTDLMNLLRHETGHAINYAYELFKEVEWKKLFGDFNATYPTNFKFKFNPFSKSYVKSRIDVKYYAQAHPDEDFAETFALWLTPRSNWKKVYEKWPAIRKLDYVDRIMSSLENKRPHVGLGKLDSPYTSKNYNLIEYYGKTLDPFKEKALGLYDDELRNIFSVSVNDRKKILPAHHMIRKHRRFLMDTIARWTGAGDKIVAPVIERFRQRCKEMDLLQSPGRENLTLASLTSLGTSIVMNYLHTGRYIPD